MADLLYDLLATAPPPSPSSPSEPQTQAASGFGPPDHDALSFLATLATRPLSSLQSEEPLKLAQSAHSLQLALQGLAKKSYQPVLESAKRHAALRTAVPQLAATTAELRKAIPLLDDEALRFSTTYRAGKTTATTGVTESAAHKTGAKGSTKGAKGAKGDVLARRRQALLLSRNVERLVDVLELPPLLASSVAAVPVNYASALDLNGHIRRLHALFPDSPLVRSVASEADESMRATAASLVLSLKAPGLKLAASLRTISWLRRVLPDLEAAAAAVTSEFTQALAQSVAHSSAPGAGAAARSHHDAAAQERALGAVFLVCRLATLTTTLDALAPLRELADQEQARQKTIGSANAWSGGQQTERYLKRYIEIFREQSFAIVSMFRSVFPTATATGTPSTREEDVDADGTSNSNSSSKINGKMQRKSEHNGDHGSHNDPLETRETPDPLEALPPALATFPLHLVDMLLETLRQYLPAVRDQASRDSLLTQVLYCAGSLGRLGGDFGLFLATLDVGDDAEAEWVEVVRRHRQLAGRLESIVGDPREKR
ncbi:hypothetical protein SPBR_03937 [Sporothrix brasiliensis 5110]|uniref:Conserved oligomeric Golgi complex subunit 8 n=1 Tax=Sporothrix brasiliensis 5110 TaxID=1398154 RepID=A0A0C2J8C7_9PEZI|nr:uncharacterized protein SPBR_03937 [Sporothrix brasiliensis 5110]KIH95265.1 hypothetical protein SPBR_03937 [Sporothrix brasiliensis 5110]